MNKSALAVTIILAKLSLFAVSSEPCVGSGKAFWQLIPSKPVWSPLKHFREMENSCLNDDDNRLLYAAFRAELESMVGNHANALAMFDTRGNSYDSPEEWSSSAHTRLAIQYVVNRAKSHRIVVTNERHHASSDRLLPLALLKPLFAQGYRYLAVEGYGYWDSINVRGYPIEGAGYYSKDVVYAQMLRTALDLGYTIVGYEIEKEQRAPVDIQIPVNRRQEREYFQAQNIYSRIFEQDADAKVLIHCGYSHIREKKSGNWSSMTYILKELTAMDALTVDQTILSERGSPSQEHPTRQQARSAGELSDQPLVVLDDVGMPLRVSGHTDIQVLGLQSRYVSGRPTWMNMYGTRRAILIEVPECSDQSCVLEAFSMTEIDKAVPYDRVEVAFKDRTILYLPPDIAFNVYIMDMNAKVISERKLKTES